MTIRHARKEDKVAVIRLLQAAYIGGGFDSADGPSGFTCPCDPAYLERSFIYHLSSTRACCIVHDVAGVAQGVLMALAADHPFGPVQIANETVWWIDPAHRGSAAIRMLDAYEKWAQSNGCAVISIASKSDPRTAKLYVRRGYRAAETYFLKAR